jgi:hypothetical protein
MAAVGSFIHNPTHTLNTLCNDTYNTGRRHNAWLYQSDGTIFPPLTNASPVRARLGALYMAVDTIAAGCNAITMRVCSDLAGDVTILGDTTATISTGVTTAAKGGVTFKFDIPYSALDSNFYVFWKCNVGGTCQVRTIQVSWFE